MVFCCAECEQDCGEMAYQYCLCTEEPGGTTVQCKGKSCVGMNWYHLKMPQYDSKEHARYIINDINVYDSRYDIIIMCKIL